MTPMAVQARLFEPLLNQVLRERIQDGELDFLRNASMEIAVTDLGLHWLIHLKGERLCLTGQGQAKVSIHGGFRDFLLLAARREDPDTLFFERRIRITGDTETGLLVKNLLDGMELSELPHSLGVALNCAADLAESLSKPEAIGGGQEPSGQLGSHLAATGLPQEGAGSVHRSASRSGTRSKPPAG